MNDWLTTLAALLGTVFAGAGLKLVERWLSRSSDKAQIDKDIRGEYKDVIQDKRQDALDLKKDLEAAKAEIDALEKELSEWKDKYYKSYEEKLEVLSRLKILEERFIRYEQQQNGQ